MELLGFGMMTMRHMWGELKCSGSIQNGARYIFNAFIFIHNLRQEVAADFFVFM